MTEDDDFFASDLTLAKHNYLKPLFKEGKFRMTPKDHPNPQFEDSVFIVPLAVSRGQILSVNLTSETYVEGDQQRVCAGHAPFANSNLGMPSDALFTMHPMSQRPVVFVGPKEPKKHKYRDQYTDEYSSIFVKQPYQELSYANGTLEVTGLSSTSILKSVTQHEGETSCLTCPARRFAYNAKTDKSPPPVCAEQLYIAGRVISEDLQRVYDGIYVIALTKTSAAKARDILWGVDANGSARMFGDLRVSAASGYGLPLAVNTDKYVMMTDIRSTAALKEKALAARKAIYAGTPLANKVDVLLADIRAAMSAVERCASNAIRDVLPPVAEPTVPQPAPVARKSGEAPAAPNVQQDGDGLLDPFDPFDDIPF